MLGGIFPLTLPLIKKYLYEIDNLELKPNYQVFRTDKRPLDFLGYKYYPSKTKNSKKTITTIRNSIFLRIVRRFKKVSNKLKLNVHNASTIVSYNGWIIFSNYKNFYDKYIKNKFKIKKIKEIIRNYGILHKHQAYC